MSAKALATIERDRLEVLRVYHLSDVWLAHHLMRLVRQAQQERISCRPTSDTYDAQLLWGIVPEVARRLGFAKLTNEETDWGIRNLDHADA